MTPEEMADLRAKHRLDGAGYGCRECYDDMPCPVIRLLDALAERDAEIARLRDGKDFDLDDFFAQADEIRELTYENERLRTKLALGE